MDITDVPDSLRKADVKGKINTLRSYYSKELKKQSQSQKSGAGRDDIYQSKWPYFQSLRFLQDTVKSRPTLSTIVSSFNKFFLPWNLPSGVEIFTIIFSYFFTILGVIITTNNVY